MSQSPKVSVIIPVYNAEAYLRDCLDTVIHQTLREIEVICVDDGSTDRSLAILRDYEKRDARIRVLKQSNQYAGAARNHGLRYATGEYLSFLDADDFFDLTMLEKAYMKAKKQNAEIIAFRCDLYDKKKDSFEIRQDSIRNENLPDKIPFAGIDVKKDLFRTFVGWTWDKLFLRAFIVENQIGFQGLRTSNDLLFTFFSLAKAQRITVTEEVLAHHRIHVTTSLEATRSQSWDCFYKALVALKTALKEAGLYEHFERDFVNYSLNFSLWNLYTLSWPTQELLYYHLKLDWFYDLGIPEHDEDYFYVKDDYRLFQKIMSDPYNDISPEELKHRITEQQKVIDDLITSTSFRIGRAVTWLPRRVRDGFSSCCKTKKHKRPK